IVSIATPTIINSEVPPKNKAHPDCTFISFTIMAGNTAINAKNIDPGNVICDIILSRYSEVSVPGRIPGIKPRSEERRVGKECRSRRSRDHEIKKEEQAEQETRWTGT